MHFILQETPYTICTLSTTNITVLLECKHLLNPDIRLIFFQDNLIADSLAVGGKKKNPCDSLLYVYHFAYRFIKDCPLQAEKWE